MPGTLHRPVVAIAAEDGAGGDLVAPRVADSLVVPFLGRALPSSLAAAVEAFERQSPVLGRLARASTMLASAPVERLDRDEARIRDELAEFLARASTEGGVVLGRGGAVVLADSSTAVHVLLSGGARVASRAWRSARVSTTRRPTGACGHSTVRAERVSQKDARL